MTTSDSERLHRSETDRLIFGVAGGLAKYFTVDPVIVRIAFVIFALANGVGLLIYLVLAVIMPKEESTLSHPGDVAKENLDSMPGEAAEAGRRASAAFRTSSLDEDSVLSSLGGVVLKD